MQDNLASNQAQPFIKLVQANMDLLTRFSTSPEVTSQATNNATQLFQQASESALKMMQSGAYAQMMQGMFKNYTDFMMEVSQSSMAALTQGSAAMMQQGQETTRSVIDATAVSGRRARQAA